MNNTWQNDKKKQILGLILDQLAQIWAPQNFWDSYLYQM